MTLSLVQPPPAPAPAAPPASGPGWIEVEEAARRSGYHPGYVRRRCCDAKRCPGGTWLSLGLARLEKPPGGGKARWLVHETADAKFARVQSVQAMSEKFDAAGLTDAQRRELDERLRLVRRWDEERAAGVKLDLPEAKITAHFLDRLLIEENKKLSRRTLYNWLGAYRAKGLAGLVDARWRRKGGGDRGAAAADPFIEFVKRLFLDPRQRTLRRCHIAAEERALEEGWEVRSYKACQRAIDALPKAVVTRYRQGAKAFEDQCEPAIRRDYSSIDSNDVWCGDHHDFDVMVAHDGKFVRPTVTAWQDVRSRKIVGWKVFAHAPNADVILLAFRDAAREHGLPGRVYVDNGKDYRSHKLQGDERSRVEGAFNILGVDAQHCWVYHGQSKPIERNFRTVCDQFAREFDTYCGNRTANKPEDLKRHLATGKAPTLAEFAQAFADYVTGDYHTAPHTGDAMDGRSPDQVFAEHLTAKTPVLDEVLDFACMPRYCPVRKDRGGALIRGIPVGKHGVTYNGLHFGAFSADVQRRQGQRVMLAVNNDDLSSVLVLDLDGRLICRAKENIRLGWNATSEDLRAAVAEKRKLRKTLKDYVEQRPRMADDMRQLTGRAAARRRRAQAAEAAGGGRDPNPPAPVRPRRTAVDDQLPVIRRALERGAGSVAVGAESLELDRLRPAAPAPSPAAEEEIDVFASLSSAVRKFPLQREDEP